MKFYKNLFIMLAVLVCLTGYYVYMKNPNIFGDIWNGIGLMFQGPERPSNTVAENDNTDTNPIVPNIPSDFKEHIGIFDRTKANTFEIANDNKTMKLAKQNNVWHTTNQRKSQNEIDVLVQNLLNLASLDVVEYTTDDWAKYGLDNSKKSVTVTLEESDVVYKFYLGSQKEDTKEYYVKVEDASKVFKVSEETGKAFLLTTQSEPVTPPTPTTTREKVFNFSANDVVRYTVNIVHGTGRNRFIKNEEGWNSVVEVNEVDQYTKLSNQSAFIEKIKMFAGIEKIETIGKWIEDLSKYGLSNPDYIIAFNGNGIPQTTFTIGNTVDGKTYVKCNDEVFTVDKAVIDELIKVNY